MFVDFVVFIKRKFHGRKQKMGEIYIMETSKTVMILGRSVLEKMYVGKSSGALGFLVGFVLLNL